MSSPSRTRLDGSHNVLLFIILTALAAPILAVATLHSAARHQTPAQGLLAEATLALVVMALLRLWWAMFHGVWTTYLPSVAIAVALPLVVAQSLLAGRHRSK